MLLNQKRLCNIGKGFWVTGTNATELHGQRGRLSLPATSKSFVLVC